MIDKKKYYSVKDTAILLGASLRTVYRLIQTKKLIAVRVGFGEQVNRYQVKGEEIIQTKKTYHE